VNCFSSWILVWIVQDPEIDRLYSTSPPESEQVGTFELDNALLNEYQNVRKFYFIILRCLLCL
jgi:hypothetical protein